MSAWFTSVRRVAFPLITFGLGAVSKLDPNLTVHDYIIAATAIFILLALEEFFTNVRPAMQLKEVSPLAMDTAAGPLLTALQAQGVEVRMSVFKAVRTARTFWFKKSFKMMWNINMQDNPDVNLSFPVAAGVSGECFRNKSPRIADSRGIASRPLPAHIASALGDSQLNAVACCPIYERKRKGYQSGKVIGVLNLDSFDSRAYDLFVNPANKISLRMRELAGLSSHIFR